MDKRETGDDTAFVMETFDSSVNNQAGYTVMLTAIAEHIEINGKYEQEDCSKGHCKLLECSSIHVNNHDPESY
jgi:hypothetical protein